MKKTLKQVTSILLVVVLVVSTMAISAVSTSAAEVKNYQITITTGGHQGCSGDCYSYKIIGTKNSVEFTYTTMSLQKTTKSLSNCPDLGEIKSVVVSHWAGCDDIYINSIEICDKSNSSTTVFYGGRWVGSDDEITFDKTDNVYLVTINTGSDSGAGTNEDVYFTLIDENGNKTNQINGTGIHPATDAFENSDSAKFYVCVPSDFGRINKVEIELKSDTAYRIIGIPLLFGIADLFNSDWDLASVSLKKLSGNSDVGKSQSKTINATLQTDDKYTVTF